VVAACVCLASAAAPVHAQTVDRQRARVLFQQGEEHFRRQEHQAAHDAYEAAYAAAPLPEFLFNMGQCQRELGNAERALELYRRFLATEPAAERRAIVEGLIQELEARGPTVAPAPAPVVPSPPPQAVSPPPPAAGADAAVADPPGAPRDRPAASRRIRLATGLSAVAAAALVGIGAYFALSASSSQADLDDPALDCGARLARCLQIADEGKQASVLRNTFLSLGAAALAATGVLLVIDLYRPGGQDAVAVVPELAGDRLVIQGLAPW
jgi:tetratricopeptide (TPR) repeat protein